MAEKKDGGPAFPRTGSMYNSEQDGMSLRDYFAAHAPITLDEVPDLGPGTEQARFTALARLRGLYSDAMIAERKK